jgi:ribonuclease VapC
VIVDSSALIAITSGEEGWQLLRAALFSEPALIPAPVLVEFNIVSSLGRNESNAAAQRFLSRTLSRGSVSVEPFTIEDSTLSVEAHRLYGRGNGRSGKLNILDIMVYCMAKRLDRPILCTGRDFASTDARIHLGSRGW